MINYTLTNLKEYKENQYEIKLKDHLEKYIDYDEIHFIESELIFFKNCFDTANIKLRQNHYQEYNQKGEYNETVTRWEYCIDSFEISGDRNEIVFNEIIDFNELTDGFNLVKSERLAFTYSKIISFLNEKKEQLTTQPHQIKAEQINSLKWQGTNLQFAELTKALIETKLISPELTQKEFFKRMKQFFNIDEFNESDKLKEIRERTNTTTPLLNILETSLNNWIKKKD
jgi:hypothetical protein